MSYHKLKLKQDIINTLGRAIEPLPISVVMHDVMNEGFKSQRVYTDDEILETFAELLELGFVIENSDKTYEWRK